MQGKTLYTILLAIIAVLTLAVAVLVIFLFTSLSGPKASATTPTETTSGIPREQTIAPEEQAEFDLYAVAGEGEGSAGSSQDAIFNIKSTTDHPSSYLLAHFIIIYDGGPKNSLLEKRKALFEKTYLNELKEATIEYFRSQSYADLQEEDAMQSARESLVKIYNDIVTGKTNQKIVLKIIFDKWIIQ